MHWAPRSRACRSAGGSGLAGSYPPLEGTRTGHDLISDFRNFLLTPTPNQHYSDLVPLHRGALRNVTDAERDAVDAVVSLDERR
jgi:hypothetical protein